MSFAAGAFSGGVRGGDGGARRNLRNATCGQQQGMSGSEAQLHQTGVSGSQGLNAGGTTGGGREQSYDIATGLFQYQTQNIQDDLLDKG